MKRGLTLGTEESKSNLVENLNRIRKLVLVFQCRANELLKSGLEKMKTSGLFGTGPLDEALLQEAKEELGESKECRNKVIQLLIESQRIVEAL